MVCDLEWIFRSMRINRKKDKWMSMLGFVRVPSHWQKAFSYTEVLIAAAILSIMLAPVLSSFLQSKRNFQYALDAYRADLLAKSLWIDSRKAVREGRQHEADSFEAWIAGWEDIYDRDNFDYAVYVQPADGSVGLALTTHGGAIAAPVFSADSGFSFAQEEPEAWYNDSLAYDGRFIQYIGSIARADGDHCRLLYERDGRVSLTVRHCDRPVTVDIHNPNSSHAILDIFMEGNVSQEFIKVNYNGSTGTTVRFLDQKKSETEERTLTLIAVEVLAKDGRVLRRLEGI